MNIENEMLVDATIEDSVSANCGHMVECTDRVKQTIDRLISNLPEAVILLKRIGCTSLARQIQNDLDNLVYWQKNGGLEAKTRSEMWRKQAAIYRNQHGKDCNLIGRLVAQVIKRGKFKPARCTCDDEPGDEYYCSVHGGDRDQCECGQINWVTGPHHQEDCPMFEGADDEN